MAVISASRLLFNANLCIVFLICEVQFHENLNLVASLSTILFIGRYVNSYLFFCTSHFFFNYFNTKSSSIHLNL